MIRLNLNDIEEVNLMEKLLEHGLIILSSDEKLTLDEFKAINNKLGKPLINKKYTLDDERHVALVSEKGHFGNDDVAWHNDWSYGIGNYFGTMLYNNKNAHLSTTDFADMRKAYEDYPDKDYLHNTEGSYFPPQQVHEASFTPRMLKIIAKAKMSRKFAHVHHATGDTCMYISPATLMGDIDVSNLVAHCEKNIYEHEWQDNEIVIYDNIRYMHRRHAFEGERELWRTQFWV